MNYIGRFLSNLRGYYQDINHANLTGAIDVIVVEQPDGTLVSTPFHVRFGKAGIFRPKETVVEIYINEDYIADLEMKLGMAGEAYFEVPHSSTKSRGRASDTVKKSSNEKTHAGSMDNYVFQMDDDLPPGKETGRTTPQLPVCDDDSSNEATSLSFPSPDPSICKSDTEIETGEYLRYAEDSSLKWEWGQLPETNKRRSFAKHKPSMTAVKPETQESLNPTKTCEEGIYLSELVDSKEKYPDLADRYLYHAQHRETHHDSLVDADSYDHGYRSDSDGQAPAATIRQLPTERNDPHPEFMLSLCGGLDGKHEPSVDRFLQHMISYEDFLKDPVSVLSHSDLVVRWDGQYYSWKAAASLLVSLLAYQCPVPDNVLNKLNVTKTSSSTTTSGSKRATVRRWFGWGSTAVDPTPSKETELPPNENIGVEPMESQTLPLPEVTTDLLASSLPNSVNKGAFEHALVSEEEGCYSDGDIDFSQSSELRRRSKLKTIRLTSEQLAKLNLREGANSALFSVTTQYQGTCQCSCFIYLWKWTDKIVISDIDGTITKSDVLGHIFPLVGKDWTQSGIVSLYNRIQRNDYRFIYLSARAIGQAGFTRAFLQNVRQDDMHLPDGAVLLSPSSLIRAFHKEVIERKPEEFKISCLTDLSSVFPKEEQPLYAGFGNKPNDVITYRAVGIEPGRIFTVNHRGELRNELAETSQMNYNVLGNLTDYYFPPANSLDMGHKFGSFSYWYTPAPSFDIPGDDLLALKITGSLQ